MDDPVASTPPLRDPQGRLLVDGTPPVPPFHREDIVYRGVPIGRMTYGHLRLSRRTLLGLESVGRFCSLAESVAVAGVHHPLEWVSPHPFLYRPDRGFVDKSMPFPDATAQRNRKVEIGHDVWIGEGVRILRPCRLGHGCAIAAGSVVTRDVPPYAVVAGVPARVIRHRVPIALIPDFLTIAWWDWPLEKIQAELPTFYDPEVFVRTHRLHSA